MFCLLSCPGNPEQVNVGCFLFSSSEQKILRGDIKSLPYPSPIRQSLDNTYITTKAEARQNWTTFSHKANTFQALKEFLLQLFCCLFPCFPLYSRCRPCSHCPSCSLPFPCSCSSSCSACSHCPSCSTTLPCSCSACSYYPSCSCCPQCSCCLRCSCCLPYSCCCCVDDSRLEDSRGILKMS